MANERIWKNFEKRNMLPPSLPITETSFHMFLHGCSVTLVNPAFQIQLFGFGEPYLDPNAQLCPPGRLLSLPKVRPGIQTSVQVVLSFMPKQGSYPGR
jgi:hypothetical protein